MKSTRWSKLAFYAQKVLKSAKLLKRKGSIQLVHNEVNSSVGRTRDDYIIYINENKQAAAMFVEYEKRGITLGLLKTKGDESICQTLIPSPWGLF